MTKPSDIVTPATLTPLYPLLILAGIFLVRLYLIGTYPLMDTTEARYADVARWMYASGDFITPRYPDGEPFWGKPPLSFWFTAISFKVLGVNEFAARLPSLLFSVGTVFFAYISAKKLFGKSSALTSAIILSSSAAFFAVSGLVLTDTVLTFCTTLSMASIVMVFGDGGRAGKLWGYAFFLGIGLGLLAKGPVALVLILFSLFVWALWRGKVITLWKKLPWVSGILFMLLISVPWYIAAEIKTPGFLEYYFIGEHFLRFVEPGWSGDLYGNAHTSRKGVIWLYYMAALLPWIFVLPASLFKLVKGGERLRESFGGQWGPFFLCWTLAPMVFFTMAGNVLPTYVLPGLPAFAILTGEAVSRVSSFKGNFSCSRFLKPTALYIYAVIVPLLFITATLSVLPDMGERKSRKSVSEYIKTHGRQENDRIVYIGSRSFSVDFYNNGHVEQLPDARTQRLFKILDSEGKSFFIVKNDQIKDFLSNVDEYVKKDSDFVGYTLYSEI